VDGYSGIYLLFIGIAIDIGVEKNLTTMTIAIAIPIAIY